jgi:putative ABC transport system permease protein
MLSLHSRAFLRMIKKDWEIYLLQFTTLAIAFATAILIVGFLVHEFSLSNNYDSNVVRILRHNESKAYEGLNRLSNRIPEGLFNELSNDSSLLHLLLDGRPFRALTKGSDSSVYATLAVDPDSAGRWINTLDETSHLLKLGCAPMDSTTRAEILDIQYILQPAREIYFGPRVVGENIRHGDVYCIIILSCISALIIILAATNFINLVSLTLPARSKELAMRKVAGANRPPLLGLLAKESMYVVVTSLLIAGAILIGFAGPAQEYFYVDRTSILILIVLFVAIAAAPLFPAWAFIKASPGRLLSTDTITFPRMKKVITVFQLGISISLIIASLVIDRQISRSLIKEPGKNHDQVVYTTWPQGMSRQYLERLKNEWPRDNLNILQLTAVSHTPDNIQSKPVGEDHYQLGVDYNFRDFFRLDMVEGRWFGTMDDDSVMVNEAGISTASSPIGVVQNFSNAYNLPDKPMHLSINRKESNFVMIRVLEVDIRKTLESIERSFTELSGRPTRISFLDHNYADTLAYEDRLNKLSSLLALVSGIMACCSIYALSLSRMNDNVKQIAIRKTFGASDSQIVGRLSYQFLELMLGSLFFFGPLTYLLLSEWLRNFAYAAKFSWSDPLISIGICLVIVLITNVLLLLRINTSALKDLLRR